MQYLELPFATLIGWLIFGDLPNGLAALGIAVTLAAGLYVIHRERAAASPSRPPSSPASAAASGRSARHETATRKCLICRRICSMVGNNLRKKRTREDTMRLATLIGAASLAFAAAASAQDYPTGPVTIVVPFAAGGPTDTVTRLIAEPMSASLGQQVVVQNVGGAGGTLGATQVAKATADGYTLLLHHIGMSTAPSLYADLAFDLRPTSRRSASSPACR